MKRPSRAAVERLLERIDARLPYSKLREDDVGDFKAKVAKSFLSVGNVDPSDGEIRKRIRDRLVNYRRDSIRAARSLPVAEVEHALSDGHLAPAVERMSPEQAREIRDGWIHHSGKKVRPKETQAAISLVCRVFDPIWLWVKDHEGGKIDHRAAEVLFSQALTIAQHCPPGSAAHERCEMLERWIEGRMRPQGQVTGPVPSLAAQLLANQTSWLVARRQKTPGGSLPPAVTLWAWLGPEEQRDAVVRQMFATLGDRNVRRPTLEDARRIAQLSAAIAGVQITSHAARKSKARRKKRPGPGDSSA